MYGMTGDQVTDANQLYQFTGGRAWFLVDKEGAIYFAVKHGENHEEVVKSVQRWDSLRDVLTHLSQRILTRKFTDRDYKVFKQADMSHGLYLMLGEHELKTRSPDDPKAMDFAMQKLETVARTASPVDPDRGRPSPMEVDLHSTTEEVSQEVSKIEREGNDGLEEGGEKTCQCSAPYMLLQSRLTYYFRVYVNILRRPCPPSKCRP
jgi:hypothetical protein